MAEAPAIQVAAAGHVTNARAEAHGPSAPGLGVAPTTTVGVRPIGASLEAGAHLLRKVDATGAAVATLARAALALVAPELGAEPSGVVPEMAVRGGGVPPPLKEVLLAVATVATALGKPVAHQGLVLLAISCSSEAPP